MLQDLLALLASIPFFASFSWFLLCAQQQFLVKAYSLWIIPCLHFHLGSQLSGKEDAAVGMGVFP